jgi:ADP-ribose pyrophosphatase YjhB (NUDIX family)
MANKKQDGASAPAVRGWSPTSSGASPAGSAAAAPPALATPPRPAGSPPTSGPIRIDYFDDPRAPAPNSVVPSANVVVTDDGGQILVIHRPDNGNWAVPGGAMDLGESLLDTAIRTVKETTGVDCEITGLVGVYTDPRHVILLTDRGEARQEFSLMFTARAVGGTATPFSDRQEVLWVHRHELGTLRMDRSMRLRILHFLEARPRPYLG